MKQHRPVAEEIAALVTRQHVLQTQLAGLRERRQLLVTERHRALEDGALAERPSGDADKLAARIADCDGEIEAAGDTLDAIDRRLDASRAASMHTGAALQQAQAALRRAPLESALETLDRAARQYEECWSAAGEEAKALSQDGDGFGDVILTRIRARLNEPYVGIDAPATQPYTIRMPTVTDALENRQ